MKLKTALLVLISAASLTALTACGKKESQEQQAEAPVSSETAGKDWPVTDTPVSEEMMDAAPLENAPAASEAK
ncbi:hypothetical protein [Acinetobacter tianfuensis]|uniref:Lipoprotein n=1 Tax=Acinetobacter tianfuensis TaxID=2419603 RepID=A0A3A8ELK7_9GAMM|nr:hypothetical protein [Acinetobacter tianfuensis]RKG29253.1 hypothetical protein D7V32_15810 [Acinetobacter tianfuensis]